MIFTFSKPVIINEFTVADIDANNNIFNDAFTFEGISFTSVSGANCNYTVTSATPTTFLNPNAEYARWLTSTTAITSFTINYLTTATPTPVTHAVLIYAMKVTVACAAGTTAPTLSTTTISNNCTTSPYINLNSLVSTTPAGASLVWYTNNTRTGNPVLTPTTVDAAGTYYAFYYDAANDCYSPASAAVTATYNECTLTITKTCPEVSVDLSSRVTGAAPTGFTYTYHSGTPATTANKLPSGSVVTTSGTYYVSTYYTATNCYTATSRPINVTIPNCCSSVAPPTVN
jgi:hypothetical protein